MHTFNLNRFAMDVIKERANARFHNTLQFVCFCVIIVLSVATYIQG